MMATAQVVSVIGVPQTLLVLIAAATLCIILDALFEWLLMRSFEERADEAPDHNWDNEGWKA